MPVIKFSALVNDMKGKMNGSVFAGSTSGTVLRGIGSRSGKRSALRMIRNNSMVAVASSWRSLNPNQQKSWNDAAPNFTAYNKVGDVRVMSGYELFVKCNSGRKMLSESLLNVPPAPPTFEPIGSPIVNFSPLVQYVPGSSINTLKSANGATDTVQLISVNPSNTQPYQGFSFCFSLLLDVDFLNKLNDEPVTLWGQSYNGGDSYIKITSQSPGPGIYTLALQVKSETNSQSAVHEITPDMIGQIVTVFGSGAVNGIIPIGWGSVVNAVENWYDQYLWETFGSEWDDGHDLSAGGGGTIVLPAISDARWYDVVLSRKELIDVSNGYVLGSEISMYNFEKYENGFENNSAYNTANVLRVSGSNAYEANSFVSYVSGKVPRLVIEGLTDTSTGSKLRVYATAPLSTGKTSMLSRRRWIGDYTVTEGKTDISGGYSDVYGYVPADSTILFECELIDIESGLSRGGIVPVRLSDIRYNVVQSM